MLFRSIRTWRPWERSTGPRTPEGQARVAKNAWKGGHRQKLREVVRIVNAELGAAKELLADIPWVFEEVVA